MGLLKQEEMYPGSHEKLVPWLEIWFQRISYSFLSAYLKRSDNASFIPQQPDHIENLLRLFLIEKAVYEADYEMNNRPDWMKIPLNGLARIIQDIIHQEE
jgi:maltose alpha-D-glucosyltransferase/alpha-amylase